MVDTAGSPRLESGLGVTETLMTLVPSQLRGTTSEPTYVPRPVDVGLTGTPYVLGTDRGRASSSLKSIRPPKGHSLLWERHELLFV